MKIIFMGTPQFAVPVLEAIYASGHSLVQVVTQPDRPRRRGLQLTPSPVKEAALGYGLEAIYQPEKLRRAEELQPLLEVPADVLVTVAYGQLLPVQLLQHPRLAAINVHASLLPRYRGAAPIQRALFAGESESGVTIMHMASELDTGDIISQRAIAIDQEMNYGALHDSLSLIGAELLMQALTDLEQGRAARTPQEQEQVSYAPRLSSDDQLLDWNRPARELHNQIRALDPAPGAETMCNGAHLKVWRSRVIETTEPAEPGTLLQLTPEGPLLATGNQGLLLLEVQPAGKKRMAAKDWLRGVRAAEIKFT